MGQCSLKGVFMGEKIPGPSFREYFSGGRFIELFKSFGNNANLSTQSKHIQRCKYKLFNSVKIIQHTAKHLTYQIVYKSFSVVKAH